MRGESKNRKTAATDDACQTIVSRVGKLSNFADRFDLS
jgi:hypothetical protein